MPAFFRSRLLNELRDELHLTRTFQKVTLFHLFMLMMPTMGIALGLAYGKISHSWLNGFVVAALGSMAGVLVAWFLPQLLWNMLGFFARKQWFVMLERQANEGSEPIMTSDEFIARGQALRKGEWRRLIFCVVSIIVTGLGMEYIANYMDRTNPPMPIQMLTGLGMIALIVGLVYVSIRAKKQLFRRHGLLCPTCSSGILDLLGGPDAALCKHCGTKIVATSPGLL